MKILLISLSFVLYLNANQIETDFYIYKYFNQNICSNIQTDLNESDFYKNIDIKMFKKITSISDRTSITILTENNDRYFSDYLKFVSTENGINALKFISLCEEKKNNIYTNKSVL